MALKEVSHAYIREWMKLAGLKQSDLVKKLDWSKAKANSVWHGEQRYNQDILEAVATLVNARSHELLMPPDEAMRIRQIQAAIEGFRPVPPTPPAAPAAGVKQPHRKAS